MKKVVNKVLSSLLIAVMLLTMAPWLEAGKWFGGIIAEAATKKITEYSVGDIIEFGSYPQTEVTDSITISVLNSKASDWQSYGYMSGSGTNLSDGSAQKSNYMQYCDIQYNGKWYRGVIFKTYRPKWINYKSTANEDYSSLQHNFGYYINIAYWFEYEPIQWRVLDPAKGFVLCETIIDSQSYSNTCYKYYSDPVHEYDTKYYKDENHKIYASNYYESSIREWLNDEFYNTAFTDKEKSQINDKILRENKCYSSSYPQYDSKSSEDSITLLDFQDLYNTSYGFSGVYDSTDTSACTYSTDYAKCQGYDSSAADVYKKEYSWWLRTASLSNGAYTAPNNSCWVGNTFIGVRPALNLKLTSPVYSSLPSAKSAGTNGNMTINFCNSVNAIEWNQYITNKNGQIEYSLKNVNVKYNGKTVTADNQIKLSVADAAKTGAVLSKSDYRNYIVPKEYFESYVGNSYSLELDAFMSEKRNDGRPYVSTVFGKESGNGISKRYIDITQNQLEIEQSVYYDIIISAGDISGTTKYVISQDDAHKIENTTGKFTSQELYSKLSYDTSTKTYVYVISNGKTSEPIEIKLKKVLTEGENTLLNSLDDGEVKLLGNDGLSIKISGTGFIDGMEFSLDAFKDLPIGFEKDGNTYKVSLGLDLWGASHGTKKSSTTGTKWKKNWEYDNFIKDVKELSTTTLSDAASDWKKDQSKKYDAYKQAKAIKEKYNKTSYFVKNKKHGFDVSFLGYWEFEVIENTDGSLNIVTKDFGGILTGKYEYTYTQRGFVWVVPEYTYFAFSAALSAKVNGVRAIADRSVPIELNVAFDFSAKLQVGGGVGWKDIASAGLWGSAQLDAGIEFYGYKHTQGSVTGKFGYETSFLWIFGSKKELLSGTLNLWDKYLGGSKSSSFSTSSVQDSLLNKELFESTSSAETKLTISDRTYIKNTSDWLADDNDSFSTASVSADGISFKTLQTGIFEYSQSKLVNANGKLVMVYVEDDASRDTYNRMRLMSTVYEPSTDTWSAPVAVYDDGCNDAYPSLVSDGTNVYVAWQKIAKVLTASECETAEELIKSSEIYLAEFDASSQSFDNARRITNDSTYDYMPTAAISGGNPVVYYASCTDNNMTNTANTKISKYTAGTTSTLKNSLNYVNAISVSSNGTEMTYIMDADGDVSDASDVNAYTVKNGTTNTTAIGKSIADVVYADIDGVNTMIYTDKENLYYTDQNGTLQTVSAGFSNIAGGIYPVKTSTGLDIVWTVQNDDGSNNLYGISYENSEWSETVRISNQDNSLSSVSVAPLNGRMYGVVSSTDVTLDEDDGSITRGTTDLLAFAFSDFTDIRIMNISVFEEDFARGMTGYFDVLVDNSGTKDINSVTFAITDDLGTAMVQTVDIDLPAGTAKTVTLSYNVPENYTKTKLYITALAGENSDDTPDDNTMSVDIGNTDLYLGDIETNTYANGYVITTKLYNASDITANKTAINVVYNSKENDVNYIAEGESLAVNESIDVNIPISYEDIEFDEYGIGYVYIYPSDKTIEDAECVVLQEPVEKKCVVFPYSDNLELGTVTGKEEYFAGETATVIATPNEGYYFAGWYVDGKLVSGERTYNFVTSSDVQIEARFSTEEHKYTSVVTAPTCTEQGYTTHLCTCGESYIDSYVPATGHTEVKDNAVAPTCTKTGLTEGTHCSVCNVVLTEPEEVAAIGHKFENGICTLCGEKIGDNEITLNEFKKVSINNPEDEILFKFIPNDSGTYYFFSDSQDDTYGYIYDSEMNVLIDDDDGGEGNNFLISYDFVAGQTYYLEGRFYSSEKTGSFYIGLTNEFTSCHNLSTEVIEPTCEEEGYTLYRCSMCGIEYYDDYTDALAHNFEDGKCTRCGAKYLVDNISQNEFKKTEFDNVKDEILFKFIPNDSGTYYFFSDSQDDTYGYIYDSEMNVLIDDDDGGEGNNFLISYDFVAGQTYYLKGRFYSSEKTGSFYIGLTNEFTSCHDLVTEITEPTCTEQGYTVCHCSHCEYFDSEYDYTEPLGHSFEDGYCIRCHAVEDCIHEHTTTINQIEPTCDEEGYTGDIYCPDCFEIIEYGEWLPTHYKTRELINTVSPTCIDYGYSSFRCTECGELFKADYIEPLQHIKGEFVETVNSTCSQYGYTIYNCSRCGCNFKDDYVDALGHIWEDDVCTICGYKIPNISLDEFNLVHINGYGEELFKFTPTESGEYYYCSFGRYDTIGFVYDETMNEIAEDDDRGGGNNFMICYNFEAGKTYYLSVQPYSEINDNITITISKSLIDNIVPYPGSTTVIDNDSMYIYGINPGLNDETIEDYLYISEHCCDSYSYLFTNYIGTGSKLYLDLDDGSEKEYTFVLFGDVNGDGWYDGMDAIIVSCLANGMLTKDDVSEAEYIAADCNHDRAIDQLDVDILQQAGVLLANIDQSKSAEELLETSSSYNEYLNLIDQNVNNSVVEEPILDNTPADESVTEKTNAFVWLIDFIVKIFHYLKLHFAIIK